MCDDIIDFGPKKTEEEEEVECVCTPKEAKKRRRVSEGNDLPCTCPYDPRFPNTNQTRRCLVNFLDYQRCTRLLGNYQGCRIFKLCYESLCPSDWITRWYDLLDRGLFPCTLPPKPENYEVPDESEPFDTAGY